MGITVKNVTRDGESKIRFDCYVQGWRNGQTKKLYISCRNQDSNYKDWSLTYTGTPSIMIGDEGVVGLTITSGYLSNNTRWHISVKCDGMVSNESGVTMPFEGGIPDDFIISERPTQQTQNVVYNGVYQGEAGSCVANAIASAKNIQELRNGKSVLDYSVSWFYGMAGDGVSEYLMYDNSFDLLKSKGIPPYQVVLNNIGVSGYPDIAFQKDSKTIYNQNNTSEVNSFALPQKILSWGKVGRNQFDTGFYNTIINAIKTKAVIITLEIDKSLDDAYVNGIVGGVSGQTRGGHAMILLGIKTINNKKYWVAQNSWTYQSGYPMGDNGLYYIPFSWFTFDWCGINGFYILEDDPSAPELPDIPMVLDPPSLSVRESSALAVCTNRHPYASNYQIRYRKIGTSTYTYTTSYTEDGDKINFNITGIRSGTSYEMNVRGYANNKWGAWSNTSIGTTNPYKCRISHKSYNTTNSIKIKATMSTGYDGGGYTGIKVRIVDLGGTMVRDYYGNMNSMVFLNSLVDGRLYSIEVSTYYSINGTNLTVYSDTCYAKFKHSSRPSNFRWLTPKVKGEPFNMLATEWNGFMNFIQSMSKYCLGYPRNITYVSSGDGATPQNVGQQVEDINNLLRVKYGDYEIGQPMVGGKVIASWLNEVVDELNKIE